MKCVKIADQRHHLTFAPMFKLLAQNRAELPKKNLTRGRIILIVTTSTNRIQVAMTNRLHGTTIPNRRKKLDTDNEIKTKKIKLEAEVSEIISEGEEEDEEIIMKPAIEDVEMQKETEEEREEGEESPPHHEDDQQNRKRKSESSSTHSDRTPKERKTSESKSGESDASFTDVDNLDDTDIDSKSEDENEGAEEHGEEMSEKNEAVDVEVEEVKVEHPLLHVLKYNCAIQGCRSVEEYECLNRVEEGTYGVVYRAKDKKTNELVALKRLKMEKEREGFPITSLREIDTLLKSQHPNVVTVKEIVVGSNMDKIYLVMDFVEHDLKSLMQYSMKKPFSIGEVKTLMLQLLRGIAHLHDNWIIHRDLKTSNLLLSHKGVLKIADFGLAREYGSPLKEYTPVVVTLWYRAVELLLGCKKYSTAVDMWSVGAIFGEFLLMKAIFQGKSEKDQLDKIFKDLGTPNEKIWPGYKDMPLVKNLTFPNFPYNTLRSRFGKYLSDAGYDLLLKHLTYDPDKRISAEEALKHEYFKESPLPIDVSMFPTWPAKSEGHAKKTAHDNEPKAPSAGKMYENLIREDEGFALQMPKYATGFHLK